MNKLPTWIVAAVTLAPGLLGARDLAGTWQRTTAAFGTTVRQILRVSDSAGGPRAFYISLGRSTEVDVTGTCQKTVRYAGRSVHGRPPSRLLAQG